MARFLVRYTTIIYGEMEVDGVNTADEAQKFVEARPIYMLPTYAGETRVSDVELLDDPSFVAGGV